MDWYLLILFLLFRKELKKKYPNLKPFIPPPNTKKHATPGDYFGTFGGNVPGMKHLFTCL